MLAEALPDWVESTADAVGRAVEGVNPSAEPKRGARGILFMARELRRAVRVVHQLIQKEIDSGVEAKSFVAS